ncbi:MAG: N-acetylmuramoyl-L-alanine amidase [Candidatus Omnitrophota bacterium]|nr:N-acetylmuramoyl-L-alanine amidase [Candidatus Omnitrophota bacterium]
MKRLIYLVSITGLAIILSSCATLPMKPSTYPAKEICPLISGPVLRQDIFHTVAPAETLWRISKVYDVQIADIMQANNLKNAQELEMGQRLLIPRAAPLRPVVPLYKSKKWKYIIIHHSATDGGNSLSLFNLHLKRGFSGLGYDFIINNGTSGKENGQIEVSPRWIRQENGAHCKASGMNYKGIGICMVGNFSKENVSEKQLASLVYLIKILKNYYNIPLKNIMGHGQVPGARTECPGNYFPWKKLNQLMLKDQREDNFFR